MATTRVIAKDITTDGDTPLSQPIPPGQYMIACTGTPDGATAEVFVNIGVATEAPLGISYTQPSTDIVWLPRCTAFVRVSGAGPATDLNCVISECSTQFHRFN